MKPITIAFDGNTPSKKNNKQILTNRATGKSFIAGSAKWMEWHKVARWVAFDQARKQGIDKPIESLSEIRLIIYYPDQRIRDNSNIWESVADLLVEAKVIADDCWKVTGVTTQIPVFRQAKPGWEARLIPFEKGLCKVCETQLTPENSKQFTGFHCNACYKVYDKLKHGGKLSEMGARK